jgi:hypothetical protein
MKKYFVKALILVFGLGVATTFTACHNGEDSVQVTNDVPTTNLKHSISGTILASDGSELTNATVKINGSTVAVSGSTFTKDGLTDGSYKVEISKAGYKSIEETVDLAIETVNGKKAAKNVVKVYYLANDVATTAQTVATTAQTSSEITIETTSQKDADGNKANDTEESITVQTETQAVTAAEQNDIEAQIKAQGGTSINDLQISVTNITSLEDAKAVARANNVAASRMTRATTAMPNNNELLAGVALQAGKFQINMPAGKPYVMKVKMPDDVKGAISLFRTYTGDKWTAIDIKNPQAEGIESIDLSTPGMVLIKLSIVRTQSFGFGVVVGSSVDETSYEDIEAAPITNGATARSISSMPYTVKAGVVVSQSSTGALTDFLRKIVVRTYGTRLVKEAKIVTKNYVFQPAYQMHANGTLYLSGFQKVKVTTFSVSNSNAKFTATEYGDAFVAPYEVFDEDEITVHDGGSVRR